MDADLASLSPAERGQRIAIAQGCTACYSPDDKALVGPAWLGIYGREEEADDAYVREPILQSNLKLVAATALIYDSVLSDEGIGDIIAFRQSLSN